MGSLKSTNPLIQHKTSLIEWYGSIDLSIKNESVTYFNKASSYYNKGKKKKAEETFKMAMSLNPSLIDNYIALSDMAYEKGNIDEAIEYLNLGAKYNSRSLINDKNNIKPSLESHFEGNYSLVKECKDKKSIKVQVNQKQKCVL